MRPEVARIDDQNATLHRFHANMTVNLGDKLHINFDGACYHYDVNAPAKIVGCRNDGHPVAERNGSLISADVTFYGKGDCSPQGRPTITSMCKTCWGEGTLVPPNESEPVECLDCGGTGEITE